MNSDWLPFPRYLLRKDLVELFLRHQDVEEKRCLEIGYGAGDMLVLYQTLGLEVYGYDFSELAYKSASERIAKNSHPHKNINLLTNEEDICQYSYDYLMAFEVLEHIENDLAALKNWNNLLHKGGVLLLSVPAHKRKWGFSDIGAGHYRRYERIELNSLLEESGFNVEHCWNYGFPLTILLDPALNRVYSPSNSKGLNKNLEKSELTKQSGVKRTYNPLFVYLFNRYFMSPFCLLQRLFLSYDLGSGYLVVAKKM